MVYRGPGYKKFSEPSGLGQRTPFSEILDIQRKNAERRRLREQASQIQEAPSTQPTPSPTSTAPIVKQDMPWWADALSGLQTATEYGGGALRAGYHSTFGKIFSPGFSREYTSELYKQLEQDREESKVTGINISPFQSAREQSLANEGFSINTPFENVGFDFKGQRVKLLPSKITGRGVSEVVADPLLWASFIPFVGMPIRAVEMAALGAVKGVVGSGARTLASVSSQIGKGSVTGVAKETLRAPGRLAVDTLQEITEGATKSLDIERRILKRGAIGLAKFRGTYKDIPVTTPKKSPGIEFDATTGSQYGKAEMLPETLEKQLKDATEGILGNAVKPFEKFRASRAGEYILGADNKTFREIFMEMKVGNLLGRAFIERFHGIRGLASLQGNRLTNKVAKAIHWSNLSLGRKTLQAIRASGYIRGLEQGFKDVGGKIIETGKPLIDYDENDFIRGIFRDRSGELVDPVSVGRQFTGRNHAYSIIESINYDTVSNSFITGTKSVEKRITKEGKIFSENIKTTVDDAGNIRIDFNVTKTGGIRKNKDGGYHITLSKDQADSFRQTMKWEVDNGLYGFDKEISLISKSNDLVKKYKLLHPDGSFNSHKALLLIAQDPKNRAGKSILKEKFKNHSLYYKTLKPGKGLAKGANFAHRATKDVVDANETINEGLQKLVHSRTGKPVDTKKLDIDYAQNEFVDDLVGSIAKRGKFIGRLSEMVESYGKLAIKKRSRDDFVDAMELLIRKSKGKKSGVEIEKELHILLEEAAQKNPSKYALQLAKKKKKGEDILDVVNRELTNVDEEAARLFRRHFGIDAGKAKPATATKLLYQVAKLVNESVFIPLRLVKAGVDLGFQLIQILPFAHIMPKTYAKTWGMIGKQMTKEFQGGITRKKKGEGNLLKYYMENYADFREASNAGIVFGSMGADIFDSLNRPGSSLGVFGKIGYKKIKVGNAMEYVVNKFYTPFERSYYISTDMARLELFKSYRPLWSNIDDPIERLAVQRQMSDFVNYSTGGYSTTEVGLTPTQKEIESSWLFFSPRFTRASLGLVSMIFDGSLAGVEARRALSNWFSAQNLYYIHICNALGIEPQLDPTKSGFMQVPVGDDNVGVGGAPLQIYRFITFLLDDISEGGKAITFRSDRPGVTIPERFADFPISRYIRGKLPLGTGFAVDVALGTDYLGNEIEGPSDWLKHGASLGAPFWAEGAIFADPYRQGVASIALEALVGARTFPQNAYQRRTYLREEIIAREFATDLSVKQDVQTWDDLTQAQKNFIEGGSPELQQMNEEIKSQQGLRGGGFESLSQGYYDEKDEIEQRYHNGMVAAIHEMNHSANAYSLPDLLDRNKHLLQTKRAELKSLRVENQELLDYWEEKRSSGEYITQMPDVFMDEYYDFVYGVDTEDVQIKGWTRDDGSIDYLLKDNLESQFFEQHPGMREYVESLHMSYSHGYNDDTPLLLKEYYKFNNQYNDMYQNRTTDAVFQNFAGLQMYEEMYNKQYRYLPKDVRRRIRNSEKVEERLEIDGREVIFNVSAIRRIEQEKNAYQRELRKLDPILDRFVYRWSVEGSDRVYHPSNVEFMKNDSIAFPTFRLPDYDIRTEPFVSVSR